jgi:hypothetical protein
MRILFNNFKGRKVQNPNLPSKYADMQATHLAPTSKN